MSIEKPTRRAVLAMAGAAAAAPPAFRASARVEGSSLQQVFALPPQPEITEYVASLDGLDLWVRDTGGHGEPLVLLHPATGSALIWDYQMPVFAAAGYRVIAYSRRGHFGSTRGPDGESGTGADDLKALVDYAGLDRFHLLGTAAGGFIAPDFAVSWPERLLSLTLACTLGGGTDSAYRAAYGALMTAEFRAMPAAFRELGPAYRAACHEGVVAWEELEHRSSPGDRLRQTPRNTLDWATLGSIRVPTLSIAAGADLYSPPPVMQEYASHIPDSEFAIIPESGHSAYWEKPEAFNALVLAHLARHRAKG